jgi:hypothetical protein
VRRKGKDECWVLWWEEFLIVPIVTMETIKKAENREIDRISLFLFNKENIR